MRQIIQSYFTDELARATTTEQLPFPWEDPNLPDNFVLRPHPNANPSLDITQMLDHSAFEDAFSTLAEGKAAGPDKIPNEIIKNLPENAKQAIYSFFLLMAKAAYTPQDWNIAATCLIYKPNKPDPTRCDYYRPISLMNCILKLWTATLQKSGSEYTDSLSIFSNNQDGFRARRKIYDTLMTQIHLFEDAKLHKNNIYTCYIDFQCAFNKTDHDLMFRFMTHLGFPTQYVRICKQLYSSSSTYFLTPHGPTDDIPIRRGTLQGDTLSPFLFTIFIEPLLRWLETGSRGYRPTCTVPEEDQTMITFDELGYADDLTLNTSTLEDLKKQLVKVAAFSRFTRLDLAPDKCQATAALWAKGSPTSHTTTQLLKQQIHNLTLPDKTGQYQSLQYLAPNQTHKLLGVHINPLLNFTTHFQTIATEVRQLAKVLKADLLSTGNKIRVTESLLKSKFFTLGLGLLTDDQLFQIDGIIASSLRSAYGATPSLPRSAVYGPTTNLGLGNETVLIRAARMSIEQLTQALNKPTDRGLLTRTHVQEIAQFFESWPDEALNNPRLGFPTARILRHLQRDANMQLQNITPLTLGNTISRSLTTLYDDLNDERRQICHTRQETTTDAKEYRRLSKEYKPLTIAKRLITHLTPLWEHGITEWDQILYRRTSSTIGFRSTLAIASKSINNILPKETSISRPIRTLISLLSQPTSTPHLTLPKAATTTKEYKIHSTWSTLLLPYLTQRQTNPITSLFTKTLSATEDYNPDQDPVLLKPSHIRISSDIDAVKIYPPVFKGPQIQYKVQWAPEKNTSYDIAKQINAGFTIQHQYATGEVRMKFNPSRIKRSKCSTCRGKLSRQNARKCSSYKCEEGSHTTCTEPGWQCNTCKTNGTPDNYYIYDVQWHDSYQLKPDLLTLPSSKRLLSKLHGILPRKQLRYEYPPPPPPWNPNHTRISWEPFNPYLDVNPDGRTRIVQHPTNKTQYILVAPDGKTVTTLSHSRVQKLWQDFQPHLTTRTFQEEVYLAVGRIGTRTSTPITAKGYIMKNRWAQNDVIDKAHAEAFGATRTLFSDCLNCSLTAKQYHSLYPEDAVFSALPSNALYTWSGISQANPEYDAKCMSEAMQHAIISCHKLRNTAPSATILILPDWVHSPYLQHHLISSPYVQKLYTIPAGIQTFDPPDAHTGDPTPTPHGTKWSTSAYLVANQKALNSFNKIHIYNEMSRALRRVAGHKASDISLSLQLPHNADSYDPHHEGIQYHVPSKVQPHAPADDQRISPFTPDDATFRYDPKQYLYTDGSKLLNSSILGAAVYYPQTDHTCHIRVWGDPIRNTINRAELAAIATAIQQNMDKNHLNILTDSKCSLQLILRQIKRPTAHEFHLHRDLLQHIDKLLKERDDAGKTTFLGKVKSHTGIPGNDAADTGAKAVASEEREADENFTLGGDQTMGNYSWPIRVTTLPDGNETTYQPSNLKAALTTDIKAVVHPNPFTRHPTKHQTLLTTAARNGADFSIHKTTTELTLPERISTLEHLWGVHHTRLKRGLPKDHPFLCKQCHNALTNSHMAGNCPSMKALQTTRHNSEWSILSNTLKTTNGGRWPIIAQDLGHKGVTDFSDIATDEIRLKTKPSKTLPRRRAKPRREEIDEGEEETDKSDDVLYKNTIPENLLPKHLRPKHHKPDIIRAIGYKMVNGQLEKDKTYKGQHRIQFIECKFSTDHNINKVTESIIQIYTPLKTITEAHNPTLTVEIVPIVISRTGTFSHATKKMIHQLISLKEEPPDSDTYTKHPDATQLIQKLHIHAKKWLHTILKIARTRLKPTKFTKKTEKNTS